MEGLWSCLAGKSGSSAAKLIERSRACSLVLRLGKGEYQGHFVTLVCREPLVSRDRDNVRPCCFQYLMGLERGGEDRSLTSFTLAKEESVVHAMSCHLFCAELRPSSAPLQGFSHPQAVNQSINQSNNQRREKPITSASSCIPGGGAEQCAIPSLFFLLDGMEWRLCAFPALFVFVVMNGFPRARA